MLSDGRIAVVGHERSSVGTAWLTDRYEPDGTRQWRLSDTTRSAGAVAASTGGVVVVAGEWAHGVNVRAFTAGGQLIWESLPEVPVPMAGFVTDLAVLADGQLGIVGVRATPQAVYNWLVQKYEMDLAEGNPTGESVESGKVKVVGGIRGYLDPKRGEKSTILVRPTGAGVIHLRIYNQAGQLISETTKNTTGGHTEVLHWDGTDSNGLTVPTGIYPIVVDGPGVNATDKLAVVR